MGRNLLLWVAIIALSVFAGCRWEASRQAVERLRLSQEADSTIVALKADSARLQALYGQAVHDADQAWDSVEVLKRSTRHAVAQLATLTATVKQTETRLDSATTALDSLKIYPVLVQGLNLELTATRDALGKALHTIEQDSISYAKLEGLRQLDIERYENAEARVQALGDLNETLRGELAASRGWWPKVKVSGTTALVGLGVVCVVTPVC